jgi:hypothetical protein
MIAIFLNVILMLNMIISLFGDSFDEFQVLQVYYDKKEMCEVILEMEHIFSLFRPKEERMFVHTCTDFYNEDEEGMWQGRAVDVREIVEKNAQLTQENIKAVEGRITQNFTAVEGKIKGIEENFNQKFKAVEGNLKVLDEKIVSKFDELLKILMK